MFLFEPARGRAFIRECVPLYLSHLELNHFRNYQRIFLEPNRFLNVIAGPNAQGKTNLLEAIFFLLTGRSFRTSREGELIQWENNLSSLNCHLVTRFREFEIKIKLAAGQKKIEVNGVPTRGAPLGRPGAILFSPDHLVLVKGSPQERRAFLDLELCPFQPQYTYHLQRYLRAVSQRNNLLREIRDKRQPRENLKPWNEQVCRYGARVLWERFEVLKKYAPIISQVHKSLSGGKEYLHFRYNATLKIEEGKSEEELYRYFYDSQRSQEGEEISRAHTLIGPHRDDLSFYINNSDVRTFGSQGQQRTVVLALKLGLLDLWKKETGETPLLLLDDVLFELDQDRQKALINRVSGLVQTFVTTASEKNYLNDVGKTASLFKIENGAVWSG
jgi:DNA replication and repair protein RecF